MSVSRPFRTFVIIGLSSFAIWLSLKVVQTLRLRAAYGSDFSVQQSGETDLSAIISIINALINVYNTIPDDYKGCVLSSAGAGVAAWGLSRVFYSKDVDRNKCLAVGVTVFGVTTAVSVGAVNYYGAPSMSATKLWQTLRV